MPRNVGARRGQLVAADRADRRMHGRGIGPIAGLHQVRAPLVIPFLADQRADQRDRLHLFGDRSRPAASCMPGTAVAIARVSPEIFLPGCGSNVSNWLGPPASHNTISDCAGRPAARSAGDSASRGQHAGQSKCSHAAPPKRRRFAARRGRCRASGVSTIGSTWLARAWLVVPGKLGAVEQRPVQGRQAWRCDCRRAAGRRSTKCRSSASSGRRVSTASIAVSTAVASSGASAAIRVAALATGCRSVLSATMLAVHHQQPLRNRAAVGVELLGAAVAVAPMNSLWPMARARRTRMCELVVDRGQRGRLQQRADDLLGPQPRQRKHGPGASCLASRSFRSESGRWRRMSVSASVLSRRNARVEAITSSSRRQS